MKMGLSWLVLLLALAGCVADDSECRVKQEVCYERVKVNVTTFIEGLIDDVPKEIFDAFVEASAGCLKCVDSTDLRPLGSGHGGCGTKKCRGCGIPYEETKKKCKKCCGTCRCQGCTRPWWGKGLCDDCCGGRRLSDEVDYAGASIDFTIDVCMDDVSPVAPSSSYYIDYAEMLEDFEAELKRCYEEKDDFLTRWASLTADVGIDLSTMARSSGGPPALMFEMEDVDKEGAQVTTYSSDESHRSTSHMIFYGALGFVSISAFAVLGTAVVVRILNKRKEQRREQSAKWVAEMSSADIVNPVGGDGVSSSSD